MDIYIQSGLPPKLVTRRLILREVGVDDISESLLCWLNDPETTQFLEIRHAPQTQSQVELYIRERLANPSNPHFWVYGEDFGGRILGTVTVNQFNSQHMTADISFVIGHPGAARKGYATEAVHAVCLYLFRVVGMHKITGGLYRENNASRRVFEKNGFHLEGVRRQQFLNRYGLRSDALLYGLVCSEFAADFALLGGDAVIIH